MQDADGFLFDVFAGGEKVDQHAETIRIQLDCQGIDGEIPAIEIEFDGAHFHHRQGGWKLIVFHPGGCHVNFSSIRENYYGGAEFCMGMDPGADHGRIFSGKCDAIAFDDDIEILIFAI